ncbi:MAG: ABC transporter permease, partial [Sulfitobacter sp.]
MNKLLTFLFGRLPIGWLQLTHSRGRFIAAVAGVAFANLLVFMQLGIMGALNTSTVAPYAMLNADIILSSEDGNTLTDDGHIPRARMFQALGVAGVNDATPLFIGNLPFTLNDGSSVSLLSFGMDVAKPDFTTPDIAASLDRLSIENTALLDKDTRGMPQSVIEDLTQGRPFSFETGGDTLQAIGTMEVGGGFLADGMMMMSDQTFLRVFPNRNSGAPNHILIQTDDGISIDTVLTRLQNILPANNLRIQSVTGSAAND